LFPFSSFTGYIYTHGVHNKNKSLITIFLELFPYGNGGERVMKEKERAMRNVYQFLGLEISMKCHK